MLCVYHLLMCLLVHPRLIHMCYVRDYAWFPPFRCHLAVAVSPFPLRKFRKNYVSAIRITLRTWKILLHRCRFHLPFRRNCRSVAIGSNPIFCRSAACGQPISVLVTSSLCIRKDVSSDFILSPATAAVAMERKNGNGRTATDWWKRGISVFRPMTYAPAGCFL